MRTCGQEKGTSTPCSRNPAADDPDGAIACGKYMISRFRPSSEPRPRQPHVRGRLRVLRPQ
eukprot:5562533-Alexandrium_andersonii.AAC.1